MAINDLLFSKDVTSRIKLRYRRLKVVYYYRSTERIIYLRMKSKERRNLHGPSEFIKIHDNKKAESEII